MKKQLKKGFLALALIFTLIGTQTLKNNKIGAYAPEQPLTEFNTPNILTDIDIVSYQDLIDGPYNNMIGIQVDTQNEIYVGYKLNVLNYYILELNGLEKYLNQISFLVIEDGIPTGTYFNLNIDINSSQQVISFAELIEIYYILPFEVEIMFMFNTPEELGEITLEKLNGIGLYNYNAELLYEEPIDNNALNSIYDLINKPIDDLLDYIGIDNSIILSPGFGNITWFEITLRQAIKLVIGLLIGLWFIKFILKLFKKFFSIIFGGFAI